MPSPTETLEDHLRRWLAKQRVATGEALRQQLQVSARTLARVLERCTYYRSYNHNGRYYALRQTIKFNEHGLWSYRNIGFSIHASLCKTLVALIEQSAAGMTVVELRRHLLTNEDWLINLLCDLCRQGKLARWKQGRQAVYFAADAPTQQRQQQTRLEPGQANGPPNSLPCGCDALLVLKLLMQWIRTPQACLATIQRALHRQGTLVRPRQIRAVCDFYDLEKKEAIWRLPNWRNNCWNRLAASMSGQGNFLRRLVMCLTP